MLSEGFSLSGSHLPFPGPPKHADHPRPASGSAHGERGWPCSLSPSSSSPGLRVHNEGVKSRAVGRMNNAHMIHPCMPISSSDPPPPHPLVPIASHGTSGDDPRALAIPSGRRCTNKRREGRTAHPATGCFAEGSPKSRLLSGRSYTIQTVSPSLSDILSEACESNTLVQTDDDERMRMRAECPC